MMNLMFTHKITFYGEESLVIIVKLYQCYTNWKKKIDGEEKKNIWEYIY